MIFFFLFYYASLLYLSFSRSLCLISCITQVYRIALVHLLHHNCLFFYIFVHSKKKFCVNNLPKHLFALIKLYLSVFNKHLPLHALTFTVVSFFVSTFLLIFFVAFWQVEIKLEAN